MKNARIHALQRAALLATATIAPSFSASAQLTAGTRLPTESEQYSLQLINQARTSANGLAILQRYVTNNLANITASTGPTAGNGTPWSANFWTSTIPDLATNLNGYRVHPGDLKRQFQDLPIPGYPMVWSPALGNVSSGYNQIIINNAGAGPGFPHQLAPYQDVSTFQAYARRYTDGGYGPLNDLGGLGENVAPNNPPNALFRHAAFMIDFGPTPNGIQDQVGGSHRKTIMDTSLHEIGISSRSGWSAGRTTETQEFGRRFSRRVTLTGAVFRDVDGNAFYTAGNGEAIGGAVFTATQNGTTIAQTTTYPSGGYGLELNTAGTYRVRVGGRFGTIDLGNIVMGNVNVLRNVNVPPGTVPTDFNNDYRPDILFRNTTTGATEVRFLDHSTQIGSTAALTIPSGRELAGAGDLNGDNQPDFVLFNPATRQTEIRYANRGAQTGLAAGPTLPAGTVLAAISDFDKDARQDFLTLNPTTRATQFHYLNNATIVRQAAGPSIPAGFLITGAADFNRDGVNDLVLVNPTNNTCQIMYLNLTGAQTGLVAGPGAPAGWIIAGPLHINADDKPDVVLFNRTTGATSFWILDGVALVSATRGPIAPAGTTLALPRAN